MNHILFLTVLAWCVLIPSFGLSADSGTRIEKGKFVTREFNERGVVTRETDDLGGIVEYGYDERGNAVLRRQKVSENVWAEWRREFNERNLLIGEFGPEGSEKRYLRDSSGMTRCIAQKVDATHWSGVFYDYDELGNIIFRSNSVWLDSLENYAASKPTEGMRYVYNDLGDVLSIADPLSRTERFEYDDLGNLVRHIHFSGSVTHYAYNADGRMIQQTDPNGGITDFTYDEEGNIIEVRGAKNERGEETFASGIPLQEGKYTWSNGKNVSYTDALGNATTYRHDGKGRLVETVHPGGVRTETVYDDNDLMLAFFDPTGAKITFRYDAVGRLSTTINALGERTEYFRDLRGKLIRVINPEGGEEKMEWDLAGRMVANSEKVSEGEWRTTRYTYDLLGDMTSIIYPSGVVKTIEHNADGSVAKTTVDPGGLNIVERFVYDAVGNVVEVVDPLSNAIRYEYDMNDNLSSLRSAEGRTALYRYDAVGRLVETIIDPDGAALRESSVFDAKGRVIATDDGLTKASFSYDAANRRIGTATEGRTAVEFEFDSAGRTSRLVRRNGKTIIEVSAKYDPAGQTLEHIDALGERIQYQYNAGGQLTGVLGPTGGRASIAWDKNGRAIEYSLPENRRLTYQYDLVGNTVKAEGGPSGSVVYRYNIAGQRTAVVDANGAERRWEYDAAGRLVRSIDEMGHAMQLTLDAAGNLIAVTDANGNVTRYTYDRDGFRTSVTYPSENGRPADVERYIYDGVGRLSRKITPNGDAVNYRYGAGGYLAASYWGDALPDTDPIPEARLLVRYERDSTGAVVRELVPGGGLEFEYDAFGRLRRSRDLELNASVEYEYDLRNRRTMMRVLEHTRRGDRVAAEVRYGHDASGRLTSVRHDDELDARYVYDMLGRRIRLELPNGVTTEYSYNSLDRLASTRSTRGFETIAGFSYEYDATGNRTSAVIGDGTRITYGLDKAYRLVSEHRNDASGNTVYGELFSYDAAGNRTTRESTLSGASTYTYNSRNQLTSSTDSTGRTDYRYDANGNLVAESGARNASYAYDVLNRLVRYEGSRGTEETEYYGGIWRRRATRLLKPGATAPEETRHLYDVDDITGDFAVGDDGRTQLARMYVTPMLDDNLSFSQYGALGREYYYYIRDGLGSVSAVTGVDGVIRSRYDYTAFGEEYAPTSFEEMPQRYGYTGRERSSASESLNYRYRRYDPSSGRFNQRDPVGLLGGNNLYGYVGNRPFRFVDPYGLWETETHVQIQIQAIREELGLECNSNNGACSAFTDAHAYIDTRRAFIRNPSAHALTILDRIKYPNLSGGIPQETLDGINASLEKKRLNDLIWNWLESRGKFNSNFLSKLGKINSIYFGMNEMRSGGRSAGEGWRESIREQRRKEALWELSYGQHATADPSIHGFGTLIGDHHQIDEWPIGPNKYDPLTNAENRVNDYVKNNDSQLPLDRYNPEKNRELAEKIPEVPISQDVKDHWDQEHGGYKMASEKYSGENLQGMLNSAIDDSRVQLRYLNNGSNGGLRSLLIKMGCVENADLKLE